jgi:hypothetical protein
MNDVLVNSMIGLGALVLACKLGIVRPILDALIRFDNFINERKDDVHE